MPGLMRWLVVQMNRSRRTKGAYKIAAATPSRAQLKLAHQFETLIAQLDFCHGEIAQPLDAIEVRVSTDALFSPHSRTE
jgi:hypothetical protein